MASRPHVVVIGAGFGGLRVVFWIERMVRYAVRYEGPEIRQIGSDEAERVISFKDPDGMLLELVGTDRPVTARRGFRPPASQLTTPFVAFTR